MATHDYVIDNSTGANVRADINSVLQAILTNNSSSSAPSTTAAYMWWADTTNGVLKIRNSANNGWVELLQLDGTLTLEDGSASTPALAFRDDLNTGIFSSAADTFNIATGGGERLKIDGSGITTISTTSDAPFFINTTNANGAHIRLQTSGTTKSFIGQAAGISGSLGNANDLAFRSTEDIVFSTNNDNSPNLKIDTSGRVLIGTTTEGASTADDLTIATSGTTGITLRSGTANNGNIFFSDGTSGNDELRGVIQYDHSVNGFNFNTNATTRMTIDSSGRVLIGSGAIATPKVTSHGLDIAANNMSIVFGADSNTGNDTSTRTNNAMKDQRIGAVHYKNAEEPVGVVRALNQNTANDISFGGGSSIFNAATSLRFFTGATNTTSSGSERSRIDNDGRILINRTSQISAGLVNIEYDRNTFWGMAFTKNSGTGTNIAFTNNSLTVIGSISSTDAATSYNTSSDYRLKENAVAISDGITRIKTLKPYKFNWIADETNTLVDGFFAHEVSDAVPEAITGIKDQVATDSDKGYTKGDPIYQQIDQSKLVPLLVAAVQELITKVETLEAA